MPDFEGRAADGSEDRSSGFEIALERDLAGVRVRIVGELDLATAPELDRRIEELAGREQGRLLLDLGGVEFIDSSGLAAIIRAHQYADSNGHQITVRRGGSPQVQRILELTGMLDRLTFEE